MESTLFNPANQSLVWLLVPGAGFDEIYRGELGGFPAVITEYIQGSYGLKKEAKNGTEITWEKSTWKGKSIGLINDGYLYRVFVRANSEDFEEANEMFLEKILNSFEILSG